MLDDGFEQLSDVSYLRVLVRILAFSRGDASIWFVSELIHKPPGSPITPQRHFFWTFDIYFGLV